uniref:Bacteriophage lambda head decoration protein D n=1 Tax=Candidatus Kentrum sp. LFY TaxID=2126342 RepID=A0A450WGQ1_9GAMM|nr:MAG: Bacteriophage lambda head decoration protein D [Candidatus Kentron sp. LFY]
MATYHEPINLQDLLLHEIHPPWSRDKKPLLEGNVCVMGEVFSLVDGKYRPFDPAGAGDAGIAHSVSTEAVDATDEDKPVVATARGAMLDVDQLVWPDGITEVQKAAALVQLDARGIKTVTTLS